jgi:hypothetical protein
MPLRRLDSARNLPGKIWRPAGPERATHVRHQHFSSPASSSLRNLRPSRVASANLGTAARCPWPPSTRDGTEVSDVRSTRKSSPGRRPSGEELRRCSRHTRLPADLPASEALRRSAGQGTSGDHSRGGQECGRTRGPGVRSPLALCCGWRRPFADNHPPCEHHMGGGRLWSAAEGLVGPGEAGRLRTRGGVPDGDRGVWRCR